MKYNNIYYNYLLENVNCWFKFEIGSLYKYNNLKYEFCIYLFKLQVKV